MSKEENEKKPKHPGGRPSTYDPIYCEYLLEHMKNGGSISSFSGYLYTKYKIKVTRTTIYEWKDKHQEFADTMSIGVACSELFYENIGNQGMAGQLRRVISETKHIDGTSSNRRYKSAQFNYKAFELIMRNRFGYRAASFFEKDEPGKSDNISDVIIDIPDNGRDEN